MTTGVKDESVQRVSGYRRSKVDDLIDSWTSAQLANRANRSRGRRHSKRRKLKIVAELSILAITIFSSSDLWLDLTGINCAQSDVDVANPTTTGRIALIDQLASHYPNPNFVERLGMMAGQAGYNLDYYPPEAVTLQLFVKLPGQNYTMIILRTHATGVWPGDPVAITVSDSYSQYQRVGDQLFDRLAPVEADGSQHFGILPNFIAHVSCGRFQRTLILAMGCGTMVGTELAQAFVDKGAKAFVGWNGSVMLSHTDQTFELLVKFLLEGRSVDDSVQEAMETVGVDPSTGARLSYYPERVGSSVLARQGRSE